MSTPSAESSASPVPSRELCFTWRVIGISLWASRSDKFLESPIFRVAGSKVEDERKFCFRLYPKNYTVTVREFWLSVVSQTEARVSFSNYAVSVHHPCCIDSSTIFENSKPESDRETKVGIVKYSRGKSDPGDPHATLETLIIKCSLNKPDSERLVGSGDTGLKKLSDEMSWLLNSRKFTDVEMRAGGESLYAHRVVLHARCPELLKDVQESRGSTVCTIKVDTKVSVMEELLKYFYSAKSNISQATDELCSTAVQYHLKRLEAKLRASATEVTATTEISSACKTFEWSISRFSNLEPEDAVSSIPFPISGGCLILTLALAGKDEGLQIAIRRVPALSDRPLTCICWMSHVNVDGSGSAWNFAQHSYDESDREWRFPPFVTRSWLLGDKERNLPGDTLTLKFQFAMSEYDKSSKIEDGCLAASSTLQHYEDLNELSNDMKSIYDGIISKKDVFSDISLVLKDNTVLPVHKAILFARSKSFREDLSSLEISEKIDTSCYGKASVYALLYNIYTGKLLPLDDGETFKDLYDIGSTLCVSDVQKLGREEWIANNSPDRALEMLGPAHAHSDLSLLLYVYKYILAFSDEILYSRKWRNLLRSYPEIGNTMFLTLAELYFKILENHSV